ncbi:MAG: hypothetical protein RMH77_03790 [Sulfolobales archaeon]|nr:hypothetical protein [Sulfolobales archaeon]MCX8185570.1 hypothetical protein [Sulfolobales archaeon]MDW7969513.1 hypothetical protein [Sulfolobales archaeon]
MSQQQKQSKELKIVTRPVVTVDSIKGDVIKLKLLHIIKHLNSISEKALTHLIYLLQNELKIQLKYSFINVGGVPCSKQLRDDINILLYLGLVETDSLSRKLRLTSNGVEFLEKYGLSNEELNTLLSGVDELKSKTSSIDAEADLSARKVRSSRS